MYCNYKFCDKLIQLRKERGLSQEQLAEELEVSRQAVSKWEQDQSTPSLDKIIQIADMFGVSVDYLVRESSIGEIDTDVSMTSDRDIEANHSSAVLNQLNEITQMVHRKFSNVYEYKSKRMLLGIPLVHIRFTRYGKPSLAKGILALGNVSVGVISIGAISAGILSFGALSFGLLLSLGAICLGGISIGGISVGLFACGGVAIGMYAFGGVALASKVAVGGVASATIAIGDAVSGEHTFDMAVATKEGVKQAIQETYPNMPKSLLRLILMAVKR